MKNEERRRKGVYYTPTAFVDLAHKYISDTFGSDWKEKYIVWDPAWGTGNLTRDYKFKELYCSTLEASDIHTANQMGYNPEATKFQFDFLNDDDSKVPQSLQDAINSGKEILFLINPPYATAANMGETHKKNASKNNINNFMINNNWGKASQNLYAQFLCRITEYQKINKNIKIAVFCPPLFLTGGSFDSFRSKFLNQFNFKNGFLFKASHFSDVSSDWGISFILFDYGKNKNLFNLEVVDFNSFFELAKQSSKQLYNTDNHTPASKWVREEVKGLKTNSDLPQLQNATNINIKNQTRGAYVNDALGYFYNSGNNIDKNAVNVGMWSAGFYNGHGLSIIKQNFLKCTSLFTARKCIMPNWINSKDEYLAPNVNHPLWQQFQYDSIIYSLFHIHSYQSSLRQVEYKSKLWDIKNEFFWLNFK